MIVRDYSLFDTSAIVDVLEPIPLKLPINQDLLTRYYMFLRPHYDAFFADVQGKQFAIWCYREGRGEYIAKRYLGSYRDPENRRLSRLIDGESEWED